MKKHRKQIPVTLIIVTHKSNSFLKSCLLSIVNQKEIPAEIIVIDNNSPLSPFFIFKNNLKIKKIKKKFIRNKKNLGFSKAINLGARLSNSEFILFLNPDSIVLHNAIGKIFHTFTKNQKNKNSGIVIAGGRSMSWKKNRILPTVAKKPSFQTLLFEFTSLKKVFPASSLSNTFWDTEALTSKKPVFVDMVSGSFMLVAKKLFIKLGGFDENYFMYLEDLDFCLRVKKRGYKILYFPSIKVKHFGGGSSKNEKGKINQQAWNFSKRYFCEKWFGYKGTLLSKIFDLDDLLINIKKFLIAEI